MKELNPEQDLKIDAEALDLEWLGQPNLFYRYSEALAKARKEAEKAEPQYPF